MSEQTQADNKNANDININKDSPELKNTVLKQKWRSCCIW